MPSLNNMNYTLIPCVEHTALVEIAALLWNQADIRDKIFWFPFFSSDKVKQWQAVENVVIEKVSHLSLLPKALRRYVLSYIKPIGKQIFKWMEWHKNLYFGILHLPNQLCWTMHGLLDCKKTAKALIQDKSLHVITRYKLACTYCLENEVKELWDEIPENIKTLLYSMEFLSVFELPKFLVSLWTHEIEGELLTFHDAIEESWFWNLQPRASPYKYAFEYSARGGNKAATEFFWKKLTPREREESLVECIDNVAGYCSGTNILERYNVLCFLISQIGNEQQSLVHLRYPCTMLEYLLEWPWQSFLLETADRVWDFLSSEDYDYLLNKIVLKVKEGFQDWNYKQLFGQFWRNSTSPHKRYVLDKCICGPLLTNLLHIKDMENIFLLVHDATIEEKEDIVYYRMDITATLIYNHEWNLLKILVEHCQSSTDILGKFQKEFLERDITSGAKEDMAEEKAMLKKFLKSLNNFRIHIPRNVSLCKAEWNKGTMRLKLLRKLLKGTSRTFI